MNDIKELSNETLLEEFENTMKWWHYDPHGFPKPNFDLDALTKEILFRMEEQ